jgi:rhodanese-related sulfurtransferase
MSSETWDTLGNQKKTNYALRPDMSKSEFIDEVTAGLMEPPQYFALNAALNKKGYASIDKIMKAGLTPLSVEEFKVKMKDPEVMVLDVRDKNEFSEGFIPGSLFIGLDGTFAPWVGALIEDINQKIILVTPEDREEEAVRRLARVGYDHSIGYLAGGIKAWKNAGEKLESIEVMSMEDFGKKVLKKDLSIVDVRKPGEYESTHVDGAISIPLDYFPKGNFKELDKENKSYVHCRSGFRSTVASSMLYQNGYRNIVNVIGDVDILKETDVPLKGNCPSLLVS